MDLSEIRKLALTNEYFLNITSDVFSRKLSESYIFIDASHMSHDPMNNNSNDTTFGNISSSLQDAWSHSIKPSKEHLMIAKDDWIQMRNLYTVLDTLEYFGDAVKAVKISQRKESHVVFEKIIESLNEHCTDSLLYLDTVFSYQNLLKHMTKPFKNLNQLSFLYSMDVDTIGALPMNQLFPNTYYLLLDFNRKLNSSYLGCHLPKLEYLKIRALYNIGDWAMDPGSFEELILKNNPQIKTVDLSYVSEPFLKVASEHLKALETLIISRFRSKNELHFPSVTKFIMNDISGAPENITLASLEEVQMTCNSVFCDAWIDFFAKHTHLKRLFITNAALNIGLFENFLENLPDLQEVTFTSLETFMVHPNVLTKFIEKHDKLQNVYVRPCTENFKQVLQEQLEKSWNITNYLGGVSIRRKL